MTENVAEQLICYAGRGSLTDSLRPEDLKAELESWSGSNGGDSNISERAVCRVCIALDHLSRAIPVQTRRNDQIESLWRLLRTELVRKHLLCLN